MRLCFGYCAAGWILVLILSLVGLVYCCLDLRLVVMWVVSFLLLRCLLLVCGRMITVVVNSVVF